MKKDWKYIIYLSLFIGGYVTVQLLSPKQHDWSINLSHTDQNPYGTYVLNELLPDLFDSLDNSNLTFYEIINEQSRDYSLLSLSTSLNMDEEDSKALLEFISAGHTALLSAHYFSGTLADTLNLSTADFLFSHYQQSAEQDSIDLFFLNPILDSVKTYPFSLDNIHNYFKSYDTTRTTIVSRNSLGEPVTLRVAWGEGSLILNCTPLVFTNINLLHKNNDNFAAATLSHLSSKKLMRTEYYHLGRLEASTPLRFILTTEPLAWAYYIVIISVLLFILFEAKRKQRIIPVIEPVRNTSLEFVSTISNLYYQQSDHKNIASKKITFFYDVLRSHYNLTTYDLHSGITNRIAQKTGNEEAVTEKLFSLIRSIEKKPEISADELIELNNQIENFLMK